MPNQIEQVEREVAEFERTKTIERLESAAKMMQRTSAEARQVRTRTWLKILSALERHLDPNFDFDDRPSRTVTPPLTKEGQFHSGASPKAIKDPVLRAEYEAAIKKNNEKSQRYRLQLRLRYFDDTLSINIGQHLTSCYTSAAADQKELDELLVETGVSAARKEKLKKLLQNKGER